MTPEQHRAIELHFRKVVWAQCEALVKLLTGKDEVPLEYPNVLDATIQGLKAERARIRTTGLDGPIEEGQS